MRHRKRTVVRVNDIQIRSIDHGKRGWYGVPGSVDAGCAMTGEDGEWYC